MKRTSRNRLELIRPLPRILISLLIISLSCTEKITQETKTSIGNRPPLSVDILRGLSWSHAFQVENAVDDTRYSWQAIFLGQAPHGTFDIDSFGVFTFSTALTDSSREYGFRVILGNGSEIIDNFDFMVRVRPDEPLIFQIERSRATFQGLNETMIVQKVSGTHPIGRIDLSIAFDSTYMRLESVEMGAEIDPDKCNWDRMEYYVNTVPGADPSVASILRLTAIADDPDVEGGASCLTLRDYAQIFRINFLLKDDPLLACGFLPLRFIWTGCRSNAAYSASGDSVYTAGNVIEVDQYGNEIDITGADCNTGHNYSLGGECDKFFSNCVPATEFRNAVFLNGGVSLVCSDSIGVLYGFAGDITCDGLANVTDAVAALNYLFLGDRLFLPSQMECATRGADANLDGIPFTMADAIFLMRYIFAGARYDDLNPFHSEASFIENGGVFQVSCDTTIAGVHCVFRTRSNVVVTPLSSFFNKYELQSDTLRLVLGNLRNSLPPGTHDLFRIEGDVELVKIDVSDFEGNLLRVVYNKK